jgi:hypothetical protein
MMDMMQVMSSTLFVLKKISAESSKPYPQTSRHIAFLPIYRCLYEQINFYLDSRQKTFPTEQKKN